jgi:hypothetical protein
VTRGVLPPEEFEDYLHGFPQHPVAYHMMRYGNSVHRNMAGLNHMPLAAQKATLTHKIKSVQLINAFLNDVREEFLQPIMLSILILWCCQEDHRLPDDQEGQGLFVPHLPADHWMRVWSLADRQNPHAKALFYLVERAGGVDQLTLPCLAKFVAR